METSTLLEVILVLAALWAAFKMGQWTVLFPIRLVVNSLAQKQGKDPEQFLRDELTSIVRAQRDLPTEAASTGADTLAIERHNGSYYAYSSSGQFLAQGMDFLALFTQIKQQYPGRDFRVDKLKLNLSDQEADDLVAGIYAVFGDANVPKR